VEDGIAVHIGQVEEILLYIAGQRIDCKIRIGHRIKKSSHAPFQHLDKRILDRILARAAQYGMLQDMRDSGVIGRRCAERNGKQILFIIVGQMKKTSTGILMNRLDRTASKMRQRSYPGNNESMPALPRLEFLISHCHLMP